MSEIEICCFRAFGLPGIVRTAVIFCEIYIYIVIVLELQKLGSGHDIDMDIFFGIFQILRMIVFWTVLRMIHFYQVHL